MNVFSTITGLILSSVADNMPTKLLTEGETLNLAGDMSEYFIIIRSGQVNLYSNGELISTLQEKRFIGEQIENQEDNSSNLIVSLAETNLLLISKERYYELLSDNLLFAHSVIQHMTA
jgi:CRP-like cAMP-binding protein